MRRNKIKSHGEEFVGRASGLDPPALARSLRSSSSSSSARRRKTTNETRRRRRRRRHTRP